MVKTNSRTFIVCSYSLVYIPFSYSIMKFVKIYWCTFR